MHRAFTSYLLGTALLSLVILGCGGGSSGNGNCDVNRIFTQYNCSAAGCHDAAKTGGNFDMMSPGLESRLVGVLPPGGGTTMSKCATINRPYLDPGSNPATGLFLDKLKSPAPCGDVMPMIGARLTAADLACVQTWANELTM